MSRRYVQYKVRNVYGHKCFLPKEDDLVTRYISGGIFVNFRRKFRKFLMVSASSPECKAILKSTAKIRIEEYRHLKKYYHMIHPFSEARMTWELIMIVVYFSLFILMPMEIGTPVTDKSILYTKFILDMVSFLDIGLFFVTGYFDVESNKIIMRPRIVCKHYIFGFFIPDVVSSIPYNMYIQKTESYHLSGLKYFYIVKLVRVATFINYLKKFCIRMDLWSYKMTIINFIFWFCILLWYGTSGSLKIYTDMNQLTADYFKENPNTFEFLMESCYQTMRQIMLVAISEIYLSTTLAITFNISAIMVGCVLNMIILAQVMQQYKRDSSAKNKYDSLMEETREYMNYKELPIALQKRVLSFVEFKFQKNIFNENDFMATLSRILKQDVMLHTCKNLVEKVDFFKGLPSSLLLRLVVKLKSEIYLTNDKIVQAGIPGNAMYFIYVGTVAVYTSTGKEICHLEDGDHFGEIALVINEPRVASVIAITNCEVFRLSRKDFLEAVEPYPIICFKIRQSALARLRNTQMLQEHEHELEPAQEKD